MSPERQQKGDLLPTLTSDEVLEMISKTADGMFAIESNGQIIFWNHVATQLLGFEPDEAIGEYCFDLLPGHDLAGNLFCFENCSVITMAKRGQPIKNYNVQMMTKTNRAIWINMSIILISRTSWPSPVIVHFFRKTIDHNVKSIYSEKLGQEPCLCSLKRANRPSERDLPLAQNIPSLTPRQMEVLLLLAQCLGAKEIAQKLHISLETAKAHIQKIILKLKTHSKLEAVILAMQHGLISTSNLSVRLPQKP